MCPCIPDRVCDALCVCVCGVALKMEPSIGLWGRQLSEKEGPHLHKRSWKGKPAERQKESVRNRRKRNERGEKRERERGC